VRAPLKILLGFLRGEVTFHPLFPVLRSLLVLALPLLAAVPALAAAPEASPGPRSGSLIEASRFTPAVLRLSFTGEGLAGNAKGVAGSDQGFLDLTLIPPTGDVVARRVEISTAAFAQQLRDFYRQLAKQEPMGVELPGSPARQLYDVLFAPVAEDLRARGITTLLISADIGLQGIPYAALHDGKDYLGVRYAISLTPSIGLMRLDEPPIAGQQRFLAVGASEFKDLAPLPLVPQELKRVDQNPTTQRFLNSDFTEQVLMERAGDASVTRVHVATHADFLPGGPSKAKLYTGKGPMNLSEFASLRQRRQGAPLDLVALSACRTALGDNESELGFAGLALQAGARSAIGSLWYVDDVATSAFFVQYYRYLDAGFSKAEAMQATRTAFARGTIRSLGSEVMGSDSTPLLQSLTPDQRNRIAGGLQHPFFWAGFQLLGEPW
jgi:CHAT domain-containing protein